MRDPKLAHILVNYLREGVQGTFFWRIRFELWAQVPLITGETFGEVLGPRRPTVSEPRPAQKLGVKIVISPRWS